LKDILLIYQRKVTYKKIKVEQRVVSEVVIHSSQGELKQILSNLISNAIDASKDGGRLIIRARPSRHFKTGNQAFG
jgi:signal transduction histidine kinase